MQISPLSFPLESQDCELLVALEGGRSLSRVSEWMKKDSSVLSRKLQAISEKAPVLEKKAGRWSLTALGKEIVRWTQDAYTSQTLLLRQLVHLRIATTREFGARILSGQIDHLFPNRDRYHLTVLAFEEGVEKALLTGEADLGFDCGHPQDPLVAFKRVVREKFVVVASRGFIEKYQPSSANLLSLPHLQYTRLLTPRLLKISCHLSCIAASFNDIAMVREACIAGLGWAILPAYTVAHEVNNGEICLIRGWSIDDENFGVWWIRGRAWLSPVVQQAVHWLKKQKLDL